MYSANDCWFSSLSLLLFLLNIPQNYFGLYFSRFGNYSAYYFLPIKHSFLNFLNARLACSLCLPCCFLTLIYSYFFTLHSSVNHGAIFLAHLLGFCAYLISIFFTTPYSTATFIRNYSTCSDLASLLSVLSLIIAVKWSLNSYEFVYSFHLF